jgi:hypothetical protein
LGSPVTGNPHGRCDRERRCAKQLRIAIVAVGDGIAQPMRSPVGDCYSFVGDLCHGVAGSVTGIVRCGCYRKTSNRLP